MRLVLWPSRWSLLGFPGGSAVKNPPTSAGDVGSIPGLGRFPGEGNGNPLQYSYLGNPMARGIRQALWSHGVTKSQTWFSNETTTTKCCLSFRMFLAHLERMCVCLFVLIWCSVDTSSVQSLSRVQLFVTPWTTGVPEVPYDPMNQASLSITNS